jgi:tetratricopeptide (TPR) repeat protein
MEWGDKEKAKELFDKALKIQEDNIQVLNSYGNACVEWEDKKKAIELLDKSLSIDPEHEPTLHIYAKACAKWGDKEKEQQLLNKIKTIPIERPPAVKAEKPKEVETPSTPTVIAPEKKEPKLPQEVDKPEPQAPPVPKIKSPEPFLFTPEEKAWLISYKGKKVAWTGPQKWAAFGMLYTLYYHKGELNSAAHLGWMPSLEREYHRLLDTAGDLYQMIKNASYESQEQPPTRQEPLQWKDEWFKKEGKPLDLISYFDNQMLTHPQNPICAAFLCQTLEAYAWGNIAAEFRKQALQWTKDNQKEWQPYMTKSTINLLTPKGKEKFLTFLKTRSPEEKLLPEGTEPVTEKTVASLVGRFSVTWENIARYFPWKELTPIEQNSALNKLLHLVEKLKNILKNILDRETGAFDGLKIFVDEDLSMPTALMGRLDRFVDEREKPEPIPWYAAGEILEIKENTLRVSIDNSDTEVEEREIPRNGFPDNNPKIGQRFFAKIDKDKPDIVYDIKPLRVRKRTFDEIFISLFGKDIYNKASAHWKKEDEP